LHSLFCFSMYISKRALRKHFDPREYPPETYLLCELQWGGSDKVWQHWVRNYDYNYHAEEYFLQEIFEPRSYNICDMTWYLSWSPCDSCCRVIRDFLEDQPNVNIDIHVARLYYEECESNRSALRELNTLQGVNYLASVSPDYIYCWDTFIQPGVNYHFSPRSFESRIERNRLKLEDILRVSTL
ncbi:ABEC1 enzyme, partial [Leptocoma aspasia]|nr:ABEC1 enzyme [Leptocoma aspasia]